MLFLPPRQPIVNSEDKAFFPESETGNAPRKTEKEDRDGLHNSIRFFTAAISLYAALNPDRNEVQPWTVS
jgi:hypothetical protein